MLRDFFILFWQLLKDITQDNVVWLSILFIIILSMVLAI